MSMWPRVVLAFGSVTIIGTVAAVAVMAGPEASRRWMLLCGGLALVAALQSVTSEQRDLAPALLLSLPPLVALVLYGSPTWLIAPLAVLLLVAGELNALSWECRTTGSTGTMIPRRLLQMAELTALGLGGSVVVYAVGRSSVLDGTGAVVLAAIAVAALGYVVLRR